MNNQTQYNMKSLVMNKDPTGFGHSYMMFSGETTPKAKNVHLQKKTWFCPNQNPQPTTTLNVLTKIQQKIQRGPRFCSKVFPLVSGTWR